MKNNILVKSTMAVILCFTFVFGINKSYAKHTWHENSEGRWYESEDDKGNYIYFTNGFKKINGKFYYFNKDGYVLTGKHKINGKFYYFNIPKGYRIENQWIGDYYFGKDGVMLTNTTTPDGYKVDKNGRWITDRWLEFSDHWEYVYANGTKAKNKFEKIDKKYYYFDSKGYMVTGWREIGKNWYYFYDGGSMAKSEWIGDYYLGSDGKMLSDTITPDGYRVDKNGKCIEYGWKEFSNHWEYIYPAGTKAKDRFEKIYGKYYYFDSKGYMVTGWRNIGKNWYYFYDGGSMAKSEWVGDYYLGSDGKMLSDTVTPDGYRVDKNGKCIEYGWKKFSNHWEYIYPAGTKAKDRFEKIYGKYYYFDSKGYMVTGWREIGKNWYYFYDGGSMAKSEWVGSYYLSSNGKMLINTITPDGYRVNSYGACIGGVWKKQNGYWIYRYDDGVYAKDGWRKISDDWYYFNSSGKLLTNTITPDGYRVDHNGKISTADWYLRDGVITAGNIKSRVGSDFVVVSLNKQKMWVVRNGDVKIETGIISGKPSTPTLRGRFNIQSKERSRYLVGPGYRSWVAYWIPFWGDYGIHDANWQYRGNFYNKNAYLYYGSHGCINVNSSVMGDVFYYTYIGMPVVVY